MQWGSKATALAALLLLTWAAAAAAAELRQVSEAEFSALVETENNVVALFSYTEDIGCAECRVAEAEVAALADGPDSPSAVVVVVDCEAEAALCRAQGFHAVPAILLFSEQLMVYEFDESFVSHAVLRDFVARRVVPKTTALDSIAAVDAFVAERSLSIVGFFSSESSPLYGSFRRTAAHQVLRHDFGAVVAEEEALAAFLEHYDLLPDAIVMFQRVAGELRVLPYAGQVSRKRLVNWIERSAPWLAYHVQDAKFREFAGKAVSIFTFYVDGLEAPASIAAIHELERIADDFRGHILFSYMDVAEADPTAFTKYGFSGAQLPIGLLYDSNQRTVFAYPEGAEVTSAAVAAFCDAYWAGKLRASIVKQQPPTEEEGDGATTLVYDTFRGHVFDAAVDAVVFFFLPEEECPHCIRFLDEFDDVAEELADEAGLFFGKIDMAANQQAPGTRVRNFPTIKFFPRESKHQEKTYDGPRTAEDVEQWVRDNISVVKVQAEQHRLGFDADVLL